MSVHTSCAWFSLSWAITRLADRPVSGGSALQGWLKYWTSQDCRAASSTGTHSTDALQGYFQSWTSQHCRAASSTGSCSTAAGLLTITVLGIAELQGCFQCWTLQHCKAASSTRHCSTAGLFRVLDIAAVLGCLQYRILQYSRAAYSAWHVCPGRGKKREAAGAGAGREERRGRQLLRNTDVYLSIVKNIEMSLIIGRKG